MPDIVVLPLLVSVPALVLVAATIVDAVRRPDLRAGGRVGWVVVAALLPVLGTFIYLLARPMRGPANVTARVNDRTEELVGLIRQHEAGDLSPGVYQEAKRRLFSHAG